MACPFPSTQFLASLRLKIPLAYFVVLSVFADLTPLLLTGLLVMNAAKWVELPVELPAAIQKV